MQSKASFQTRPELGTKIAKTAATVDYLQTGNAGEKTREIKKPFKASANRLDTDRKI